MKRHLSTEQFETLAGYPLCFLAYCSFRRALRHTPQLKLGVSGTLVCIVPDEFDMIVFRKAAEYLLHGELGPFYEIDERHIVCFDNKKGSRTSNSLAEFDLRRPVDLTVLLIRREEEIPEAIELAADLVVALDPPSPRQIVAARSIVRGSPISQSMAAVLAGCPQKIIGAALARRRIGDLDLSFLDKPPAEPQETGPTLTRLPGYKALKDWANSAMTDLNRWRNGEMPWSEIDRGVLVSGPPGSGKTLFAEAFANACGLPLIATSAGQWQANGHLGQSLHAMRATFERARKLGGAVLFIDELDSVGDRVHFHSNYAFYETNFLNGLLECIDGVGGREGLILVGATNFPERIDKALLRSGRFERHVPLTVPDQNERAEMLSFHLNGSLAPDLLIDAVEDLEGESAADMERLAREVKRLAREKGRTPTVEDVWSALPSREAIAKDTLVRMAVHECGHGLVALGLGLANSVTISVQPTYRPGVPIQAGGKTQIDYHRNMLETETALLGRICVSLGGLAAEDVMFGDRSIGSGGVIGSDLETATRDAVSLVCSFGLGKNLTFLKPSPQPDKRFNMPDDVRAEVNEILDAQYQRAKELLSEGRAHLQNLLVEVLQNKAVSIDRPESSLES